ncbi:MAG TPA: DEAD/DEAH box helicase, partial [Pyrinomonadaceae bacterium]|nr:DEAD/DEAH box helicase [Pyrinomonadaceae bacterium]
MTAVFLTISSEKPYVEVVLPIPIRKNFTYRLPAEFAASVKIGARVLVPFGKRTLTGYAVGFPKELKASLELDESAIKDVIELVDEEPLFTDEILGLTKWTADYYAASWGEMLKASLPAGINAAVEQIISITTKGKNAAAEGGQKALKWKVLSRLLDSVETPLSILVTHFGESGAKRAVRELVSSGFISTRQKTVTSKVRAKFRKAVRLLSKDGGEKPLTDQQKTIIEMLASNGGEMLFTDLLEKADVGASPVNTLAKLGLLEVYVHEVLRDPLLNATLPDPNDLILNAEQSFVLNEIEKVLTNETYEAFLLHGVTGSGKTEVYIRAMRSTLDAGKSAMMLVPEIALTPIFSRRLRSVFGNNVAILHSNLSPGERFDEWRRIRSGAARIAIGTRSAIFAPLHDLGLLIVD